MEEIDFRTGKLVGERGNGSVQPVGSGTVVVKAGDEREVAAEEPMVTLSMRVPAWLKIKVGEWAGRERRKTSQMAALLVEEALTGREVKKVAR